MLCIFFLGSVSRLFVKEAKEAPLRAPLAAPLRYSRSVLVTSHGINYPVNIYPSRRVRSCTGYFLGRRVEYFIQRLETPYAPLTPVALRLTPSRDHSFSSLRLVSFCAFCAFCAFHIAVRAKTPDRHSSQTTISARLHPDAISSKPCMRRSKPCICRTRAMYYHPHTLHL
ncbi:LAQU0S04e09296g1_1 [Lachancea quebecensis]|uniref:LAQU0S04e09296g1_1 n=1 Tax=Lachancea quebecensis TaxID=1654605 RepID=A0A0N7MLF6_9SACH|nr:LAQU0S04e09296g1_1 [Lachancea quebecensis]